MTAAPTVVLVSVALLVAWLGDWGLDRTAYWATQRGLFLRLNEALSSWPGALWFNLTLLGDGAVLLAMLSPVAVASPRCWASVLAAAPIAGATSVLLKRAAAVPRPARQLDPADFVVIGDSLTSSTSLPSGHAITVFAGAVAILAALLSPCRRLRWRWILLPTGVVVASVVSLSRVAVGAHWPLDVVAGACCGWLAGLAGFGVTRRWPAWQDLLRSGKGRQTLAAACLALGVVASFRALDGAAPYFPGSLWVAALCGTFTCACVSNNWPGASPVRERGR